MLKRAIAASTLVLLAAPFAAVAEPLKVEDFSRYPNVSSLSMSLEGDMLVGVVADPSKNGEALAAAYWDLSGNIDTTKPLVPSNITPSSGKTIFYGATALKDKKSLWFTVQPYIGALMGCGEGKETGSTKKYLEKVYMGNERIKKIDDLPDGRAEVGASKTLLRCYELVGNTNIASLLPLDPSKVVLTRTSTKNGTSYFEHDLSNGREKFLYKANPTQQIVISSRTGMPVARMELEFESGAWKSYISLPVPGTDKFAREDGLTTEISNRYTMDLVGQQNGTNSYFIATDKFSDKVAIYLYDATTDKFSDQPVFAHPEFDASSVIFSSRAKDFGEVLGFRYQGPVSEVYWVDAEMKSIQDGLDLAFPGKNVSLIDYTADRNRVLFSVSAGNMPPSYFLLMDKTKVAVIGSERPWIDTNDLGEVKFDYYTARDGLEIPAFITYPAGWKEGDKARGAIIVPHGGPWARDSSGFDASGWMQYFASRGYIVMQPQYRGSAGWGRKLWLAGDGEWGQKMQDDKDDGAAWLVSQGYVDADKIAIHGYSYGGFAAFAASVRPNSPYQCAIAGAGVANLTKLGNTWGENRIQRIVQGNTVKGMDPMQNTDKINIPILIYHGEYDVRVPIFHSRDFYNAIKDKEPKSKFIPLDMMGHQSPKWPAEQKGRILEEVETFLHTACNM
ncbi:prolyl oligopeptidase family serine peptidase [Hyphomonas sp. WL0036]|uniref:alpha/beta hydrolase family protein n=1 Tax=Hyphomonas sediminis TaxID=2866160 RepID=UPI001C80E9C0|nr:prolyl oligopeptidase family serine peptidase [Hyphomonas sediminis]MBY9067329.1 prolyl oligopeptidase family serine peptidase [Hyphomonas sediminis]